VRRMRLLGSDDDDDSRIAGSKATAQRLKNPRKSLLSISPPREIPPERFVPRTRPALCPTRGETKIAETMRVQRRVDGG